MEEPANPDVSFLMSLCNKEGGYKAVAHAIGVNDQSIYQIISGVKLPSGRPKGVGPQLREKLNGRYPGWNTATNPYGILAGADLFAREYVKPHTVQAWPFEDVDKAKWDRLTERQKGRVEAAMNAELARIESEQKQANSAA